MSRRKSVCSKWTLVLLVVLFSPFVYTRPQDNDTPVSSTNSVIEKATENPIRYRYKRNVSLDKFNSPIANNVYNNSFSNKGNLYFNGPLYRTNVENVYSPSKKDEHRSQIYGYFSRSSRFVRNKGKSKNKNRFRPSNNKVNAPKIYENIVPPPLPSNKRKPAIRKIITKWTDRAEDLDISNDASSTETGDTIAFTNSLAVNEDDSTESVAEKFTENSDEYSSPVSINKISTKIKNKFRYRPSSHYPEHNVVHSNKVHIIDQYPFPSARPLIILTSPRPTPIITNVGTPAPWPQQSYQNTHRRPATPKPIKQYNTHSSIDSYPQSGNNNFEVNTFQPAQAYTERIVIRPEEYSASSDDCPTIYLTLNNTFQGQAKEACPDLNIAVNTNVINKNVVVESEEEGEGDDGIFPGGFGLPLGDDSASEEGNANDYFETDETQEQPESASVEANQFSNYNAHSGIQADSSDNVGSASHHQNAAISKPGKPGHHDDDDVFSISGIMDFFRPAMNGMSWLAAINPLSFSVVSLILTPLALVLAAISAIAAFFAPLTYAREAPKIVHVPGPEWEWDDEHKTWHLSTFPNNIPNDRRWPNVYHRYSKELEVGPENNVTPTLFYRIKEWMKSVTNKLKDIGKNMRSITDIRKNKRKKRETWMKRIKNGSTTSVNSIKNDEVATSASSTPNAPRNVKNKTPVIGDSIKMVATQLLENPANSTVEAPVVIDTRIPPKLKPQVQKQKIKTRQEDGDESTENSHAGIAVPVTMEELEKENKIVESSNESSTSNEGISTWILLSNPAEKDNATTEATKINEPQKKQKPTANKNKTKRPPNNKVPAGKRPIIGSTNKSDLVAGGSAINENVYNKIKDTVLTNVQKNKNTPTQRTTTTTTTVATTTPTPITETLAPKKESATKAPSSIVPVVKVTSKPTKKKNKNKQKTTTTVAPVVNESALLPMEPKEQEIELEVSTPATTTKKPKRTSTRKKNKTKKRKTKPKTDTVTAVSDIKTNKTKTTKTKKPTSLTGPITSQIYSYFSREVMPSAVGVGVLGLASLVGLAGYFLYPFATPVRRTFEVDKKDDLYRHNAEEYASEGNGQAEEEMLGTVLAGMPAHSKQKLNPYAGQTTAHINRYPVKKEQDIRYRHVANKYEPNYNVHYPQQKTGLAHGVVYPRPMNYNPYPYETRHAYTTETKYTPDKGPAASYSPQAQPAVEPIYAAPQTGPSAVSSYENDASNSVVYGVKPSSDTDFKPVYPYDGQYYNSETTNSPMTYPPTSMYLGSNDENINDNQTEDKYEQSQDNDDGGAIDNKFVVGNVPKELSESATPAVVPEHGPRKFNRRKRSAVYKKRSISGKIEEVLKEEKVKNQDIFISNEIDEALGLPKKNIVSMNNMPSNIEVATVTEVKDVFPVYSVAMEHLKEDKTTTNYPKTTSKSAIVESVSTIPIDENKNDKTTTESEIANELETTTKSFRVYEVFSSPTDQSSPLVKDETAKPFTTTEFKNMNTETTTELKSDTTSTMPPSPSPITDSKVPMTTLGVTTTSNPEVLTYPPLNQESGFFTFLKRLIEFKYRLGLSILQTTSDNLNRYLRSMDETVSKVANASKT